MNPHTPTLDALNNAIRSKSIRSPANSSLPRLLLDRARLHLGLSAPTSAYVDANEALSVEPSNQEAAKLRARALYAIIPNKRQMDSADRRWLAARECVCRGEFDKALHLLLEAEKRFHSTKHLMLLAEVYIFRDV
jgi:hypothetical protein